jgi:small conductance mechanosensitive channel
MTALRTWLAVGVCLAAAYGVLPAETPAYGQIPGLPLGAGGQPGGEELPRGVTRRGLAEVTGVYLDGRALFEIASPVVFNRAEPGELIPVEVRAREIEAKLHRLLSRDPDTSTARGPVTRIDPESLRIRIGTRNRQPVLIASGDGGTTPEELLTVTEVDAQYHGLTGEALARRWRQILEEELYRALEQRQPHAAKWRLLRVTGILLMTLLLSVLLGALSTALGKRRQWLRQQQQQAQQATASRAAASQAATARAHASRQAATPHAEAGDAEGAASPVTAVEAEERHEQSLLARVLGEQLSVERRLHANGFLRWLLFWALAFVWVAAAAAVLYEFPQTRGVADRLRATPRLVLIAWFVTGLLNGLVGLLIDRLASVWSRSGRQADDPRTTLRVPTVAAALKGLAAAILYTIAVIWVLESLRIIPVTVVALGAVVALALSFAAQSLVKDLVNGLLILLEDQYALGDDVVIGGASGVVERLNLRITQLRTADGRLVTIPNHTVTRVENKTRLWSRVDLRIAVAYDTDVDRALAVVSGVAEELAHDPRWRPLLLDAHELLGVEEVSHAGIVIRLLVKTLPFKQGSVASELRRRLKVAFDREGILIGMPQQAVRVEAGSGTAAESRSGSRGEARDGREEVRAPAPDTAPGL